MEDNLLKLEIDNLKELLRLKGLNDELLEANYLLLDRLVKIHQIEGRVMEPEITAMLGRIKQILRDMKTEPIHRIFSHQPKGNTENINSQGNNTILKVKFKN